jgi:glycosyl transferase family 2
VSGSRIAACLIAGASASGTIRSSVASALAHVDEVVIFDTGLSEAARDAVASLAADGRPVRVERGEWQDDFAWAREQSFERASDGIEWLLWLDADDVLDGHGKAHDLIAAVPPGCDGLALLYEYAHDEDGNPVSVLWRERVVRRSAGYRWRGRVHEVLVPPEVHGVLDPVDPAVLRVVHRPQPGRWHPDRNIELLRLDERDSGGEGLSPRALRYLAGELAWRGDFDDAAASYRTYLETGDASARDERLDATERLVLCLRGAGRPLEGLALAEAALGEAGDWLPLVVAAQEAAVAANEPASVLRHATRAHELDLPTSLRVAFDPTGLRVLPALRLAEGHVRRGDARAADAVLAGAAARIRNGAAVEETRSRLRAAADADDPAAAGQALHELAARYDEVLHAVVRGLRIQAERVTVSEAGPSAHA